MRLLHWSDQPIKCVHSYSQHEETFKPRGLWVSDESTKDGWSAWCHAENFRNLKMQYCYEVSLRSDANIIMINSGIELDHFHKQHCIEEHAWRGGYIDWHRVAKTAQGVIITPYLWSHRLDGPSWYYSWDCASGCIWDYEAVDKITLIQPPIKDEQEIAA